MLLGNLIHRFEEHDLEANSEKDLYKYCIQKMMRNLHVHLYVINFLKEAKVILTQTNSKNSQIKELITQCFLFLTKFCEDDNLNNKKKMYKHLEFFYSFMHYNDF